MSAGQTQGPGTDFRAPLFVYTDTKKTKVQITDSSGNLLVSPTQAVKNANAILPISPGNFGDLKVAHVIYDFAVDGGAQGAITPVGTVNLPNKAIIVGGTANIIAAVTSLGSATVSIGTSAGSSATSILAATAKASLTLAALLNIVPVFATPIKLTAAGNVTFTVGAADVTAGKIEAFLLYYVASN